MLLALQCSIRDVVAVVHAVEVDFAGRGVRPLHGFGQVLAASADVQDAPAGGKKTAITLRRAGMEYVYAFDARRFIQTVNFLSGFVITRIDCGR